MKRFILVLLCLLIICGLAFYFISVPRNITDTHAVNGKLDLTGNSFDDNIFRLDGEWEFYFGKLYTPEDFIDGKPESRSVIHVPSSWDEAGYPLFGFATYRLTVLTNEPELLMLIPEIYDASSVWINGNKVFEAGTVSGTESSHKSSVKNAFMNIKPIPQSNNFEDGQFEIIIHAENYNWYSSGLIYSIELGHSDILLRDAGLRRVLTAAFIGLMLAMFIYHGILFIYRSKEYAYIIFALFCLSGAVRFILETNGLAALLIPDGMGAGSVRLFTFTLTTQAFLLVWFTHTVFDIPCKNKIVLTIYGITFMLPLLLIMFSYGTITPLILTTLIIPFIIAFVFTVRSKQLRENPFNISYVVALFMYIILPYIFVFGFGNRLYMAPLAHNLFLILCQCLILSISYAEAKQREEKLTERNNFLNTMSHKLLTPLTKVSTNIQVALNRPDEADELLNKSQGEIMKMADMINSALDEKESGK